MKRTILIVENNDECRKILEMTFSKIDGVTIRAVATAEEALPHAASGETCALVTELELPQISGFDLIEFFRSQSGCSKMPVLVVSGENDPDNRTRATSLGANAFFAKPFYPSEVRRKLLSLI